MTKDMYNVFSKILREELLIALGCTEPISIAYCSAKLTEVLKQIPEHILVECSADILKNVKGVLVPNSGNLKGVKAAAILGAIGGKPSKQLEVLADINNEHIERTKQLLNQDYCQVKLLKSNENLHLKITGKAGIDKATIELLGTHTQIVKIVHNDKVLFSVPINENTSQDDAPVLNGELTIKNIIEFSENVDLDNYDLREILKRQIDLNLDIANEGLSNSYGASIGKTLMKSKDRDVETLAKAYAAAASDARMGGCTKPVVINSGSGNQGITVSLPVIQYSKKLGTTEEKLLRALIISNLIAIRIKSTYGRLSAFCGVVGAAAASGAAITWLHNGSYEQISSTIINTLANISGVVCDGAKSSCASKIASAVDAAILGHNMSMQGKQFMPGDGVVKSDVESTINSIGRIARDGMQQTDKVILELMFES